VLAHTHGEIKGNRQTGCHISLHDNHRSRKERAQQYKQGKQAKEMERRGLKKLQKNSRKGKRYTNESAGKTQKQAGTGKRQLPLMLFFSLIRVTIVSAAVAQRQV
jgi:hypothetical protein